MKLEDAIKSSRFNDEKHKATINMLYTTYWLKTHFSRALKTQGLTMEQHNVLRILKGSHPTEICVKDIASRIVEQNSNVPRIIDRLVAKKLVKRTPSKEDKRETLVSLTEKGMVAIDQARKLVEEVTAEEVAIDEKDAKLLNDILEKMRNGRK